MGDQKSSFGYWGSTSEELLKVHFPLHRACRDGDAEALGLLLVEAQHGIYNEDSFYGWTPAHWASYFGKLNCLMRLLEHGMNCDVATVRLNQTPTHIAAFGGQSHCLKWLLHCGSTYNRQDYLGETPVHKAARTGSMECISLLVSSGADITMQNYNGLTASQLATSCGHPECAKYLDSAARPSEPPLRGVNQELLTPFNGAMGPADMDSNQGLNGGMLPPNTTIPSDDSQFNGLGNNGVHHGHNGVDQSQNGATSNDCEMDMEISGEPHESSCNGFTTVNSVPAMNTSVMNGGGDGLVNGHTIKNGHADVLMDRGVITNHVPIGGRKRVHEEIQENCFKRMRRGDYEPTNDTLWEHHNLPMCLDLEAPVMKDEVDDVGAVPQDQHPDDLEPYKQVLSLSTEPLILDKAVHHTQDENYNDTRYWPIFF